MMLADVVYSTGTKFCSEHTYEVRVEWLEIVEDPCIVDMSRDYDATSDAIAADSCFCVDAGVFRCRQEATLDEYVVL